MLLGEAVQPAAEARLGVWRVLLHDMLYKLYAWTHICVYIYTYICIERERDG